MRVASVGHAAFVSTLMAIGILGPIKGDFPPIWQGGSKGLSTLEVRLYLSTSVVLASGIGLLWRRRCWC